MPVSEARKKANRKYDAKAYDQVSFRFPKGRKAEIQAAADKVGQSLNGFVTEAIDKHIEQIEAREES